MSKVRKGKDRDKYDRNVHAVYAHLRLCLFARRMKMTDVTDMMSTEMTSTAAAMMTKGVGAAVKV